MSLLSIHFIFGCKRPDWHQIPPLFGLCIHHRSIETHSCRLLTFISYKFWRKWRWVNFEINLFCQNELVYALKYLFICFFQTFEEAVEKVKSLKTSPSNDELLEVYALFKQATIGDNTTAKPGMFDLKGKAKWSAWDGKKGKISLIVLSDIVKGYQEVNLVFCSF